jgi:hypothetical protein
MNVSIITATFNSEATIVRCIESENNQTYPPHRADYHECYLFRMIFKFLIGAKILEIKRACGDDPQKIRDYIKKEYSLDL